MKKLSAKAQLEATNRMLVDDMNFLIQAVAIADIHLPIEQTMRKAVEGGIHTAPHARDIAGRVTGYLTEAIMAARADQGAKAGSIELPRILVPAH
jgi:hypothetical protein